MASFQHTLTREAVRRLIQGLQIRQSDIPFVRRVGDSVTAKIPIPLGTSIKDIAFEKFSAELIRPAGARKDFILLYLHGGGYVLGSAKTHRAFIAKLANECGIRALSVDYRLAPENPFPSSLDDALEAYFWLIEEMKFDPSQILIGGDSAGGGLALATMLALKKMKKPLPLAAVCLAPWTDLTVSGQSIIENKTKDTMIQHFDIPSWAKMYYSDYDPQHPLISPLFGDLEGLPPILIQVSEDEMLRDDAVRFAWKAREAGVEVELQKWKGLIHVWQMFWQYIPEARDAIKQMEIFMNRQIQKSEMLIR
ncbi:MAG: alpha/beta hydrolase [Bacteroidia bacterium]|nr:alpha/beta hydrolase [Bacteroidia bacterium]